MPNYIDLVICECTGDSHPSVYRAPCWSDLKKGDVVIVQTEDCDKYANVERCITINTDDDELEFILIASGVQVPLKKVLKKVTYNNFTYEDDPQE